MFRSPILIAAIATLSFAIQTFAEAPPAPKTPPTSEAAVSAPVSQAPASEAPPVHDKLNDYTVRTDAHPCTGSTEKENACIFETSAIATTRENGSIVWERQIYSVSYKPTDKEKPRIGIKSAKLKGKNRLSITNTKGDTFELELGHGHLKSPKKPRDYTKIK